MKPFDIDDAFAYLDGDLTPRQAEEYAAAAEADPAVQAQLEEAKAARALFPEAAQSSEADWRRIDAKVLGAILEADAPSRGTGFWQWLTGGGLRPVAMAGAFAVLLVASYAVWQAVQQPGAVSTPDAPPVEVALDTQNPAGAGDVVAAGRNESVVTVSDATMTLRPASVAKVVEQTATTTLVDVIGGEVAFDVGKRAVGATFRVRASDVLVTVVGTRFTVTVQPESGDVSVAVEEGVVRVQRGEEPAATLRAGDAVTLAPHQDVAEAPTQPADPTQPDVETPEVEAPEVETPEAPMDEPLESPESVDSPPPADAVAPVEIAPTPTPVETPTEASTDAGAPKATSRAAARARAKRRTAKARTAKQTKPVRETPKPAPPVKPEVTTPEATPESTPPTAGKKPGPTVRIIEIDATEKPVVEEKPTKDSLEMDDASRRLRRLRAREKTADPCKLKVQVSLWMARHEFHVDRLTIAKPLFHRLVDRCGDSEL